MTGSTGRLTSGSPRWPRRPRGPGTRRSTRNDAAGRVRQDHARHRRARHQAGAAGRDAGQPLAPARFVESRDGKSVFRLDREAVRRAARTPSRRGRRSITCCATNRATSCSIRSASAKTKSRWRSSPTAPTWCTICAPISPSRWACRSAIRSARAAARQAAELLPVVQHSECRGRASFPKQTKYRAEQVCGEATGARGDVRPLSAGRRRRRAVRRRAHAGERRQHRFLHRPLTQGACARARSTPTLTGTC